MNDQTQLETTLNIIAQSVEDKNLEKRLIDYVADELEVCFGCGYVFRKGDLREY